MINILCSHIQMDTFQDDKSYANRQGIQKKTRKPYGFMQSSFWVIMMVHVMVCGDL